MHVYFVMFKFVVSVLIFFLFFKQKTAYEMRISDWSSDVCSSDLAMHEYEVRVHDARRESELTPDDLGKIWYETQVESLGPSLAFDDDYRSLWAYIPHFIHVPFYVYAYAFGDCLVNSLRSEEHTSELQSLMRISYAVFCLKK